MKFFLTKIRLSWYFALFFGLYLILAMTLPQQSFTSGALTLFSVNSFLYGFYIAPILSAQKSRIEELHRTVRSEANELFAMALGLRKLPEDIRHNLRKELNDYLRISSKQQSIAQGEKEYEDLITYCVKYKGKEAAEIQSFLDKLVANQKNRTQFSMLMSNKVFSNGWMIMLMLFSITLGFVLLLEIGDAPILILVKALLCTGLSMLLVILAKFSTLTHKKARQIWDPFKKLSSTNFYRID